MKKTIFYLFIILLFCTSSITNADYFNEDTWEAIINNKNTVDYPVIFLHGMAGSLNDWEKTIKTVSSGEYFEMRYFLDDTLYHNYLGNVPENWFWNLTYYTVNPVEESINGDLYLYALRLRKMIEAIKGITGHKKVVIIGHSMGGIVARKYMTLSQKCWDSVHKILTVASPHEGVAVSIGVVGQLKDIQRGSSFIIDLNKKWHLMQENKQKKWGVIGGISKKSLINRYLEEQYYTDAAGPGFVTISSAIPFSEWEEAFHECLNEPVYDTEHFGFRLATEGTHKGLLYHKATMQGIEWAMTKW